MYGNIYKTGIVIPCYNEAKRLNQKSFVEFIRKETDVLLLFVDDGSLDDTKSIIKGLSENNKSIECLFLEQNAGKAEAVRIGINHLLKNNCQYVGYFDADLSTPLENIKFFENSLTNSKNSYSVVMGSRVRRLGSQIQRKSIRHIIGRIFATLASFTLKLPVYDTQCGAKLFKNNIASKLFNDKFLSKWLFDVEVIARIIIEFGLVHSQKKILEYPLEYWKDDGGSRIKFIDFIKMPFALLRLHLHYHKNIK